MSATDIQFDPYDPADAREVVRFGTFGTFGRVAVWPGGPEQRQIPHPALAPVVFICDTNDIYAEQIPEGIRLLDAEPPRELSRFIVAQVLRALAALHAEGLHHGDVDDAHVMLGLDGQVVLFGTGRGPGAAKTDVLSAIDLLPAGADITVPSVDANANAARMEDSLTAGAQARLSGWVRTLASSAGQFDEVIRDVGPENDSTGLLDRYAADAPSQDIDEAQDEDSSTQMNAGSALWRTLAAPPLNPLPEGRFTPLLNVPSKAIQDLLRTEPLIRVEMPAVGPIDPFVVDSDSIDGDDEHTNTAHLPSAELLKAQIESKRAALVDTLTPQPQDVAFETPGPAEAPRTVAPAPKSESNTGMIVGFIVATTAFVAIGLWFMGLIG